MGNKTGNKLIGIVAPHDFEHMKGGFALRVRNDIDVIIENGYDVEVLFPSSSLQRRQESLSKLFLTTYLNFQCLRFLPEGKRVFLDMCTQMFNPFFLLALRKQSDNYVMIFAHSHWSVAASQRALKGKIPLVYVAHNVEYDLICQISSNPLLRKLVYQVENYACRNAVKILCTSEQDMEALRRTYALAQDKLVLLRNTVNVDFFTQTRVVYDKLAERIKLRIDQTSFVVLFTGRMSYHPNLDALEFIVNEFLPIIKRQKANIKIVVAGARIPKWCLKLGSEIISLYSDVEDMRQFFSIADAVIVPLRLGSGTRIKILESFAAMVPVISTVKGAEGIDCRDNHDILIAQDDVHDFMSKIRSLSGNENLRHRLINNAYELVRKSYNMEASRSCFRELISQFEG
jgi:glycosyltransferase involved in cell wall biosynthesis